MKSRFKPIGFSFLFIIVTHLLCWLVAYICSECIDEIAETCALFYLFSIIPVYFILRHYAGNNWVFWGVALGSHVLFSVLSKWVMNLLFDNRIIIGWDTWSYAISWFVTVCIIGGALLLDLILLTIRMIIDRRRSRFLNHMEASYEKQST